MALTCDLRPLTPDEWLTADLAWRQTLIRARNEYDAIYVTGVDRYRERTKQQREAETRARSRN